MAAKKLEQADYLDMLKSTAKEIAKVRIQKRPMNKGQLAELYSIYYNVFAGAIREGCMYEKTMDTDGYPKFIIHTGDEQYACKDLPLKDILQIDYERLTRFPYKDTSESYVHTYVMEDQFDEFEAAGAFKDIDLNIKDKSAEEQAKIKKRMLKAEQKKKEALLKEKNRQLLKDARGFDYDPNYDHYYSDRLPEVLRQLDSTAVDTAAKISGVAIAILGIYGTLILL